MRICLRCEKEKSLTEFYTGKEGTRSTVCKDCSYNKRRVDKIKHVTEVVASLGVGAVVGNAIKATTPPGASLYKKVLILIGAQVIGRVVSEHAKTYTDKKIDGVVTNIRKIDEVLNDAGKPTPSVDTQEDVT